jgi:AraC-like DNA-binding protein
VVNSCPQSVRRTPGAISRAQSDYFIVSLQTRGHGVIAQDGREAHLGPGDFALYDSTRPYTLHFEGAFEEIVLKLPRDRLCAQVQGMNHLTASKVSGQVGAGHLLINMINTLRQEADSLAPASAAAVASGVVSLLVAGIQSLSACTQVMPSALHAYHIMRIKKYLDTHLRDPQLSVESVAQTLGMSPGHLHRLFKDEALSPAQYLWHQRLELCGQELLNPRRARTSISAIAYECGFSDAAHFSRSFRSRFGCSPKEWRHANREHLNS